MNIKDEILNLLCERLYGLDKDGDTKAYGMLAEIIADVRKIGCKTCRWYINGECAYKDGKQNAYGFCKDYEGED